MLWPALAAMAGGASAGGGILASPWLHMGLGLLSGMQRGGNPAAGALSGLNSYNQYNRGLLVNQGMNTQLTDRQAADEWARNFGMMLQQYPGEAPNAGAPPMAMPPVVQPSPAMPKAEAPPAASYSPGEAGGMTQQPQPQVASPNAPSVMPPPASLPQRTEIWKQNDGSWGPQNPQLAAPPPQPQMAPQAPPQMAPQSGMLGGLSQKDVYRSMLKVPQLREMALNGLLGINKKGAETWAPMTPDQRKAYGIPDNIGAQISSTTGKVAGIGGGGVTVNTGDGVMKATDRLRYVHPKTGEHPPAGMSDKQAEAEGYVLTSTAKQTERMGKESAMKVISKLEDLAVGDKGVFSDVDPGMAALASRGEFAWQGVMQEDPRYRTYLGYSEATVAPLIRALGEKGTLATEDVARAFGLIPRPGDTTEVARMKIQNLKALFAEKGVKGFKKAKASPKSSSGDAVLQYDPATGKVN